MNENYYQTKGLKEHYGRIHGKRNAKILTMITQNRKYTEIAKLFNLSSTRIRQITERAKEDKYSTYYI